MPVMDYRWRPGDRRWRRLRIREAAEKRSTHKKMKRLRTALTVILCLELAVGARQLWASFGSNIRLLHREESRCVEWVKTGPGEEEQYGAASREEVLQQEKVQDVYGIRLNPDSLEIQFYHQKQEVQPSEPY